MNRDPRHHVLPGQPLRLAAEQVNALNRMMRVSGGMASGPPAGDQVAPNTILIRNSSGVDVPWLGVLNIGDPIINPTGGTLDGTDVASERARQFARRPLMNGIAPNAFWNFTRVAVCMEPIAQGAIGLAAVSGVFACRVRLVSGSHTHARARPGDVTQLESAECGPVTLLWKPINAGDSLWALGAL